ncbi:MAG: hypothetical protein ABSB76_35435 [Streptosporangiaceae bacterium]|jgi:hypothetical protein
MTETPGNDPPLKKMHPTGHTHLPLIGLAAQGWLGCVKLGDLPGKRAVPIGGDRRRDAIMAFLGAGLLQRASRAQAVAALAAARRAVASCRARGESVSQWLTGEAHHRGIRENAAGLAVLETPDHRHHAAQGYALEHPERRQALDDMLAVLS